MSVTMVRYKIKPGRVGENENLINQVFGQLASDNSPGLHYASFKLADGLSFLHIVRLDDALARNPLLELPAFKAFAQGIKDRCEESPVVTQLSEIGAHRFFGG